MLLRGIAAGAVGTTVLDAATYTDMALTGRPASRAPARTVMAVLEEAGASPPPSGARPEAYGALAGIAVGAGAGIVTSALRRVGVRLPLLAEAAVVGAGAMLATDGPMQGTGTTDVRDWSAADWTRDALPHLAFGLAVSGTLRALERDPAPAPRPVAPSRPGSTRRSRTALLTRSAAIGLATGARSSLGLMPPAVGSRRSLALGAAGLVASELVVDKRPTTPSRLEPGPVLARLALGGVGAAVLARRDGYGVVAPALAGTAAAGLGSVAGRALRELASRRGVGWQAALGEDLAALALAAWASRSS
jgi:uncharacterized membrane protein